MVAIKNQRELSNLHSLGRSEGGPGNQGLWLVSEVRVVSKRSVPLASEYFSNSRC